MSLTKFNKYITDVFAPSFNQLCTNLKENILKFRQEFNGRSIDLDESDFDEILESLLVSQYIDNTCTDFYTDVFMPIAMIYVFNSNDCVPDLIKNVSGMLEKLPYSSFELSLKSIKFNNDHIVFDFTVNVNDEPILFYPTGFTIKIPKNYE